MEGGITLEYIPFGPEWAKEVSKLPKAKIIELWGKKGIECQKLKDEAARYAGEGGWVRVEDGLPNENGYYICWCGNEPGLIHYHVDTGWQNGFYNDMVTHWMRIKPPLATTTG